MDPAGYDKKCADDNNEARVFTRGMLDAGGAVESEDIIAAGYRGQSGAKFSVMLLPMLLQNEREDCDREEKNRERAEQCRMRFDNGDVHGVASGLTAE
jgi:hypothetical protein